MSIESTLVPRRHIERGVYTWAALAAVIVVFAGFARSYYLKGIFGTPALTGLVHVHGIVMTLWFTLFQREIPEQMQSRVSSYDVLGSFVLMPIGFAIVGPLSDAIGVTETLWLSFGVMLTTWALILSLPSVWALKASAADHPTAPTLT